jgi:hypothetical protein
MVVLASETEYLSVLDEALARGLAEGAQTFESLVGAAKGAFPSFVLDRLRSRRFAAHELVLEEQPLGPTPRPELHPLDFEWYFTRASAASVAIRFEDSGQPLLCLGAPTVAQEAASRGIEVSLVDRNPLVAERLRASSRVAVELHDLHQAFRPARRYSGVFFDAPWYEAEILCWLWQASRVVVCGGLIAFALFPSLVRPSADRERRTILDVARTLGRVSVEESSLRYETPLFEAESLRALNVPILRTWRQADLVVVHDVTQTTFQPPPIVPSNGSWRAWTLGQQVVKLRIPSQGRVEGISPVPGTRDLVYTTVSQRDPSRELIDIWTSRNRVATVDASERVADLLEAASQLVASQDGHNVHDVLTSLRAPAGLVDLLATDDTAA